MWTFKGGEIANYKRTVNFDKVIPNKLQSRCKKQRNIELIYIVLMKIMKNIMIEIDWRMKKTYKHGCFHIMMKT